jgi:SOS-response transcriptional repressor LexA
MTINQIRLKNARWLVEQVGGVPSFAARLSTTRQYVHHIAGNKAFKPIGNNMARRIEEAFSMPLGWMDIDHDAEPSHIKPTEGVIDVPVLNVQASMGVGAVAPWHEQVVERVSMSMHWLRQNVQATALEYLAVITAFGTSMEPDFTDGSMLLVDRGITSIKTDAVYVLLKSDELFIKRVQRLVGGGLRIISNNPQYQPEEVADPAKVNLMVLGRVLMAWNPRKL